MQISSAESVLDQATSPLAMGNNCSGFTSKFNSRPLSNKSINFSDLRNSKEFIKMQDGMGSIAGSPDLDFINGVPKPKINNDL